MSALRRSAASIRTLVVLLPLVACGGSDETPPPDTAATSTPAGMAEAMNAMAQAQQAMQNAAANSGPRATPEELSARLPETAAGLPRVDLETVSGGIPGMTMTTVTARYEGDAGRRVEIALVDAGAAPGMAMANAAWAMASYDRTTTNGFERTVEFQGLRAMESEDRSGNTLNTKLNIMAGDFIAQLTGRDVPLDVLKELATGLDLPELSR